MANTLTNTLNKVGDAIEAVMGGAKKSTPYNDPNRVYTGQTCLERFGMEARSAHLMRNEWKRDLQYTKLLVDAEYMIQTEFKVSSYEDRISEMIDANAEKAQERAAEQQQIAKANTEERHEIEDRNAASVANGIEEDRKLEGKQLVESAKKYTSLTNTFNLGSFRLSSMK